VLEKKRFLFFYFFIILLFSIIILRLVYLQIIKFEDYSLKSAKIRARVIPNIAPRGHIYDRYGRVLASSKPIFSAYILPVKLKDIDSTSAIIANILKKDKQKIYNKIIRQKDKAFRPLLISDYISFETISLIEEQSHRLPSFVVGARNIRSYNYDSLAAHILGYIGEINEEELCNNINEKYKLGDLIGRSGIEKQYESYLKGTNGGEQIEVDPYGNPIKVLSYIQPLPGNNVVLTLDLALQKIAETALGKKKGAIVVMNPKNGDILALVSHPTFNPNIFTEPITEEQWDFLHQEDFHPLHNRALTAYPPGSIFKIVTAIAILENNFKEKDDTFYCPGYFILGRRKADCWKKHGKIDFFDGLVHSCDVVFYNMGLLAGPDLIFKTSKNLGLGTLTGVDLPGETAGLLPSSKWKLKRLKEPWYPGDSINYAIGQGFLQTTPLQMACFTSLVANKGTMYKPHLLKEITTPEQKVIYYQQAAISKKVSLKKSTWDFIHRALTQVVERGTGVASKIPGITIAGKTGTAEDPPREDPHAWFVSFAPVEDPQIVIVVFVEGGGHGGAVAAPIAKKIYKHYFSKRKKGS